MLKRNLVKIDLKNTLIRYGVGGIQNIMKPHTYHRTHIGHSKISHTLWTIIICKHRALSQQWRVYIVYHAKYT